MPTPLELLPRTRSPDSAASSWVGMVTSKSAGVEDIQLNVDLWSRSVTIHFSSRRTCGQGYDAIQCPNCCQTMEEFTVYAGNVSSGGPIQGKVFLLATSAEVQSLAQDKLIDHLLGCLRLWTATQSCSEEAPLLPLLPPLLLLLLKFASGAHVVPRPFAYTISGWGLSSNDRRFPDNPGNLSTFYSELAVAAGRIRIVDKNVICGRPGAETQSTTQLCSAFVTMFDLVGFCSHTPSYQAKPWRRATVIALAAEANPLACRVHLE